MYNTTDILTLGSDYTVADQNGNFIKVIQIVTVDELLEAALGPYTEDFESYQSYIEKSISKLSGFESVDANKILWYATSEEEVPLEEVIEYAVQHDYDKVILEYLEDLE